MDELTQHRKKRLEQLINAAPYNGDRAAFMRVAGLSKGRISQLLDPGETFGELAGERLATKLGLAARWFDQGAPSAPMAWPFVLLTQKQALSLNSANRETVEKLALHLLNSQSSNALSDTSDSNIESARVQVQPEPRRPIPVKRVAFRTPGVEEDSAKRSKPESLRAGKGRGH